MASQNLSQTTDDSETERIQSIDSLAERQSRTESKLDEILGMLTGGARPRGQSQRREADGDDSEAGRPGSVAEQVRAELARARAQEKADADAAAKQTETETLKQRLAKLEEKAPEPPQPFRQRLMWGSR